MSWSLEIPSPVAAPKLFKASLIDWHKLAPKLQPEIFTSATCDTSEVSTGSVRQFNFTPEVHYDPIKDRIELLDKEKLELKQTILEGYELGKKFESVSVHYKFEPKSDGGSICKVVGTYKTLPGAELTDDDLEGAKGGVIGSIKAVEGYILANPHACA